MTIRQQWAVVLVVVAVLIAGLTLLVDAMSDSLFPVTPGAEAPAFTARTLDEPPRTVTLADYRGKVVLLNIWATWCPPCKAEMPSMQRLHEEFGDDGLAVVAVSIDERADAEVIRAFAEERGLTFDILHDVSKEIQTTYQTTGVPESFIIGPDGRVLRKVIAAADWHSLAERRYFANLLRETGVAPAHAVRDPS